MTLREECDRLKESLNGMSDTFDGFFEYASRSRVTKGEVEFEQRLGQIAEKLDNLCKGHRHRSKPTMERNEDEGIRAGSEGQIEQRTAFRFSSAEPTSAPAASNSSTNQSQESPIPFEDASGSWPLNSLFNLGASPAFLQISLSFSSRLRHAGLKHSYRLLTSRDTPIQSLCQVFRHCIFLSNRNAIVQRVKFLLHESTKYTISTQNGGVDTNSTSRITHQEELVWTPHPVAEINLMRNELLSERPDPAALGKNNLFGYKEDLHDGEGSLLTPELQNGRSDLVHADNVEEYLSTKGLHISPGADVAELRRGPPTALNTPETLFDELRATQQHEAKVSTKRLFYGNEKVLPVGETVAVLMQ